LGARRVQEAGATPHPGGPDIWAQVYHAAAEEWAVTLDDVVRRRTTLGIRGLDPEGVRARISSLLASSEAEPVACADNRLPDVDWP
jgi:glycerol-3-phosphate dehydrogenase